MNFDDIIAQTHAHMAGDLAHVQIDKSWSQGRSVYGGISSAVLFASLQATIEDERPIRTLNVNFVGPLLCDEPFIIKHVELRVGRNVSQLMAMAEQNGKNCVVLQACFAKSRESKVTVPNCDLHDFTMPSKRTFIPNIPKVTPKFLRQFDLSIQDGGIPFTGKKTSHYSGWFKFKQPQTQFNMVSLICLMDAFPPTLIQLLKWPAPASTINWNVEFLTTDVNYAPNAWFAYHDITRHAQDGYGITEANVWDESGQLIAISRQRVGVFD